MVTSRALVARRTLDPRLAAWLAPIAVAAFVVANAWSGLMPGVGFWDTGEFQVVLPILGTAHPTGYPTYVLLGFIANLLLTPIGEPAFRITVLSLLAVAIAAGATVALVRRLTGSTIIGVAVGVGLATTPVVWLNATRADPHPIHLAFVALLLLTLVSWEHTRRGAADGGPGQARRDAGRERSGDNRRADRLLLLAAVLFGLAAGNHSLTLLLVPPIGLYVVAVDPGTWRRWQFALACVGVAFLTTVLVYLELPIRGGPLPAPLIYGKPATWDGFWYIALAEQFRGSLGDPFADLGRKVDDLVKLADSQFGLIALAIPPAFLVAARRAPRYTLLTGLAFLLTVGFNAAYSNADIQRYYLGPVLWAWTWLGILAAELATALSFLAGEISGRLRGLRLDEREASLATAAVALVLGAALLLPATSDHDARRRAADRSNDTGAEAWLAQVLPVIADNAVLVSWWSTSTPLWYAQKVEGIRPDIFVVDDRTMLDLDLGRAPDVINRYLGQRPVYAIRLAGKDTDELIGQFDMTRVASDGSTAVWHVNGPLAAAR
jgi:hypothetical protein